MFNTNVNYPNHEEEVEIVKRTTSMYSGDIKPILTGADIIQLQEIFRFKRAGITEDGQVAGRFEATGVRPRFADRLLLAGVELPPRLFLEHR